MAIYKLTEDVQVIVLDLEHTLEDYLKSHVQSMSVYDFVYLRKKLSKMVLTVDKSYDKGELKND